jgi:sialate O-acetylesterase
LGGAAVAASSGTRQKDLQSQRRQRLQQQQERDQDADNHHELSQYTERISRLKAMFIALLAVCLAQNPEPESSFLPLLSPEILSSWPRTGSATYTWEQGALTGRDAGARNAFLVSPRPYADFELRCAVKIAPGGNSGIQVRSRVDAAGDFVTGWQVEIETTDRRWSGGLYEERGRGWLDPLEGQEAARAAFRVGEWNEYRILCQGPRLRSWVNGVPCADWEEPDGPREGVIAFQVHGGQETQVQWRDLRIRELLPPQRSFTFHSIIGDHAVLPASGALISGTAPAGAIVELDLRPEELPEIAYLSFRAETGADGFWEVEFPAMERDGPYQLKAKCARPSTQTELLARDILFGDVWLCAGQSNMQMTLEETNFAAEEIAQARHPRLRVFTVPYLLAADRQHELPRGAAPGELGTWMECTPEMAARFSAVAYHFGRALQPHAGRPLGLVVAAWGGTPAESWTPWWAMKSRPRLRALVEGGGPAAPAWAEGSWDASAIFHGMISPLRGLRPRGVIWYQGESNASRPAEYEHLFPALIHAWRTEFDNPMLPFLFVQLAGFEAPIDAPVQAGSWAELREAQRLTALRTPATGMAVALDVGEARDIHPRDKRSVGERLARLARTRAYGENVLAEGPAPVSMEVTAEGSARLRFLNAGAGLMEQGGGALRGFAIAGEDGVFHTADANITSEDEVLLRAAAVVAPREVRYGWSNNPGCNLANREGLPASSFRLRPTTDLFAGGLAAHWTAQSGAAPEWSVTADGAVTVRPGAGSILTKSALGDCEIFLEFRVPALPPELTGQDRGNSGVYLQRRYELQILDSFGHPTGLQECAAIYSQRAPDLNLSLPQGTWQTYQLNFQAPRFGADGVKTQNGRLSVWHNGQLVHDDVELTAKTGAGQPEGPEPLPLLLQDHGQPVSFRNLRLSPGVVR